MDVVNGEYVPRKSILKSRSREDSVCSDTSEGSAADLEERRGLLRGLSWEEAACSDASESIPEEEPEGRPQGPAPLAGPPEVQVRAPGRGPVGGGWRPALRGTRGARFSGGSWRSKGVFLL